jgi:hypothetical protein
MEATVMQAIKKIDLFETQNEQIEISKEDILSMQIFLESLEDGIRNAKFSSIRRRISRDLSLRQQRGRKIKSDDQESRFCF